MTCNLFQLFVLRIFSFVCMALVVVELYMAVYLFVLKRNC